MSALIAERSPIKSDRIGWLTAAVCLFFATSATAGQPSSHVPSLNASVVDLIFYECARDIPPSAERKYSTRFEQSQVRYIAWELRLQYPAPGKKIDFRIEAIYIDSNGIRLTTQYLDAFINPNWLDSYHTSGYGWDNPGKWALGTYNVKVYIAGSEVGSGSFEIVSSADKTIPEDKNSNQKIDAADDLGEL